MSRSYYVIELSARWLTVLLVALAVLMVLAFGLGYGAAWSVLGDGGDPAQGGPNPTPLIETEVIGDPTCDKGRLSRSCTAEVGNRRPGAWRGFSIPYQRGA